MFLRFHKLVAICIGITVAGLPIVYLLLQTEYDGQRAETIRPASETDGVDVNFIVNAEDAVDVEVDSGVGSVASAQLESDAQQLLHSYCISCHGPDKQKGDIRLHALDMIGAVDQQELFVRMQEAIHFQEMPPANSPQPSDAEREVLLDWLNDKTTGEDAENLAAKMLRPESGNYVDHDKLFSGEIQADAFSPARMWRRNPHHFDLAKNDYFGDSQGRRTPLGQVENLKQPFNEGGGEGISDYAALLYADSAAFDTLYRNAEYVVDRTLLMAFIEYDYKLQGKTMADWQADRAKVLQSQQDQIEQYREQGRSIRYIAEAHREANAKYSFETPKVYRDIILGEGVPTQDQMQAAIRYHFERLGLLDPTQDELDKYTNFMREGIAESGPYFGLRNVLLAVLISPNYIYRSELGLGRDIGDGRRMLAPAELAYAISYALTDQKPDDTLAEAAMNGRLQTREDVRREVVRILEDNSIEKPRILRFFQEFFGYHHATEVFKDDDRFYKGYSFSSGAKHYIKDTDTLVLYILDKDEDVFKKLLSTEEYFIGHSGDNQAVQAEVVAHQLLYAYFKDKNWEDYAQEADHPQQPTDQDLAYAQSLHPLFRESNIRLSNGDAIYRRMKMIEPFAQKGITPATFDIGRGRGRYFSSLAAYNIPNGNDWDFPVVQPFILAEGKRAGILSHPSWLIAHSLNASTDPVRRGKWIRERLLAGTVPDVPITVDASVPEDPHKTLRERYAVTEAEACWRCHVKMNPLGYAFEVFDDFGRWRDRESMEGLPKQDNAYPTRPINSMGWLDGTGDPSLDGEVTDAYDLVQRLAESRRVQQSIIRHAFRYWMGRNELLTDSKTLIAAEQAYMDHGGSFEAMLISLLTSDSFIYRKNMD